MPYRAIFAIFANLCNINFNSCLVKKLGKLDKYIY